MGKKSIIKGTKRSELTRDQETHVRARLMSSASKIAGQLDQYIETGTLIVAKRDIKMTSERLAAYKLVLDRTVPTLSATEIKKTTALEQMSTEQLVEKLSALIKARPELAQQLLNQTGRVIEAEKVEDQTPPNKTSSHETLGVESQSSESLQPEGDPSEEHPKLVTLVPDRANLGNDKL